MEESNGERKWESFTDFQSVTESVHRDVRRAKQAYSFINSCHTHGRPPSSSKAVAKKTYLLNAGLSLRHEIKQNQGVEPFDEIISRWDGEDGFLEKLERVNLRTDCPKWLRQYVDDVIEAGWELGYTKAGRQKLADPEDDSARVLEAIK